MARETPTFANGASGLPESAPGSVVIVTRYRQVNAVVINSGATQSFTLAGAGGVPNGALGVIYKAFFTSPTVGAFLTITPHAPSDSNAYETLGNIQVANAYVNGGGLVQLDSNGQVAIKANIWNCTVTLYTHGYILLNRRGLRCCSPISEPWCARTCSARRAGPIL